MMLTVIIRHRRTFVKTWRRCQGHSVWSWRSRRDI